MKIWSKISSFITFYYGWTLVKEYFQEDLNAILYYENSFEPQYKNLNDESLYECITYQEDHKKENSKLFNEI